MKQIIHEGVRDDIQTIAEFGRENFPATWRKAVSDIWREIRSLRTLPNRGRRGKEPGTRELVMTRLPFVIVYRVTDVVDVLAVMYGGRQYRGRLIPVAMMRMRMNIKL